MKPPPLGSVQDRVLRKFLIRKATKESRLNKLLAHLALGSAEGNVEKKREIIADWNAWINYEFGMEIQEENRNQNLVDEYNKIRHLRPKASVTKDGSVKIQGL